jgi:hypothetical protein
MLGIDALLSGGTLPRRLCTYHARKIFARSLKGGELPPYPSRTSRSNLEVRVELSLSLCSLPLMNIFNQWNKLTCEWKKNRKKKKTVLANVFQKFHKKDIYKGY